MTMSMATKFATMFTNHEGLPLIKSHDPLVTWCFEVTWKIKNICHNAYDQKSCQGGDILQRAPTHKFV